MSQLTDSLISDIYTHEELTRRIALARGVCEYLFFKEPGLAIEDRIANYFKTYEHEEQDQAWIEKFLQQPHTHESFFGTIGELEQIEKKSPTIVLHIAVILPALEISTIGNWVKKNIDEHALIRFSYNPALAGGCAISLNGISHDFSVANKLDQQQEKILNSIRTIV